MRSQWRSTWHGSWPSESAQLADQFSGRPAAQMEPSLADAAQPGVGSQLNGDDLTPRRSHLVEPNRRDFHPDPPCANSAVRPAQDARTQRRRQRRTSGQLIRDSDGRWLAGDRRRHAAAMGGDEG
jgi:hypothetical protein